jgi:hypothetical protein
MVYIWIKVIKKYRNVYWNYVLMVSFLIMLLNLRKNIQLQKISLFVRNIFRNYQCEIVWILAEEREELEVINSFRQKQLELQHRQLLQELERLKTARETTNLSTSTAIASPTNQIFKTSTNSGQDQSSIIDSNYKHLMWLNNAEIVPISTLYVFLVIISVFLFIFRFC